jgi:catechol 2,3-dioxygenase
VSQAAIKAVSAVDLAVADLPAARDFFTKAWNLREIASAGGIHYFRAAGPAFHALSLRAASEPALIRVVLDAESRAAVDAVYATIRDAGLTADNVPRDLQTPGGGYGFGFRDPEGRNFAVVSDAARHASIPDAPDMPAKLSHVNLNCRDNDASFAVMRALGFNDNANLNHIAFEMPDLEAVMRGIGRMRDHGHGVEWGPGRHGPGHNVFAYFCGPEDLPLEYTGEMQQVSDDFAPSRKPEQWTWPAGRLDHWGLTAGPSARVKAAQARFQFSETGYRLDG